MIARIVAAIRDASVTVKFVLGCLGTLGVIGFIAYVSLSTFSESAKGLRDVRRVDGLALFADEALLDERSMEAATRTALAAEDIASAKDAEQRIRERSTAGMSMLEQIGNATAEIARSSQDAAGAAGGATSAISGVSQAAARAGQLVAEVRKAADELTAQAEALRRASTEFLAGVRAA
jgi:methyl-accepting chemotaxis protein